MQTITALYTATATATGGRDGRAVSSDGMLDVKLSTPRELGGQGGDGANPEQLNVSLPGLDQAVAEQLTEAAHQVCPYSNATRGNIDVRLKVSV